MKVDISFAGGKAESIVLKKFTKGLPVNMQRGLQNGARVFEGALKKTLHKGGTKGLLFSPYPDLRTRTGMLRRSITVDPQSGARKVTGGFQVRVGPGIVYAAIHEFGGKITVTPKMRAYLHSMGLHLRKDTGFITIPARPYVKPTYKNSRKRIVDAVHRQVFKDVR